MPWEYIYHQIKYHVNVDCFAIGVIAWELATSIRALADLEEDFNSPAADLNELYYN
jgi:hypothetical protein